MLVFLEFRGEYANMGSTLCRTISRCHVIKLGWLVIVVRHVVIRVVLVIQCEVYACHHDAVKAGGHYASHLCGVNQASWSLDI